VLATFKRIGGIQQTTGDVTRQLAARITNELE
jgi:hypothetical protein